MSTSPGTWRRLSLSSSALALVAAFALTGAAIPSPTGSAELSFTHGTGDRSSVWVADADGSHARRVARDAFAGALSASGRWIAYLGSTGSERVLPRLYATWPQVGGTWLMRPDGSGKHGFARGDQTRRRAHYGLSPIEFSRDGKRLLACTAAEFGCSPVTFTVATKKRHAFSVGECPRHLHALLAPEDMSSDGSRLLVWVGSVDGAALDDIYAVPFSGGNPRLVAHSAVSAGWRD